MEIVVKFTTSQLFLFIAGLAVAGIAIPAQAQMRGNFADADTNHDGKVSFQEYHAYASQQLRSRSGRMAQRFKSLSPQEQQTRLKQRFDAADSDHNGFLDRKEW